MVPKLPSNVKDVVNAEKYNRKVSANFLDDKK